MITVAWFLDTDRQDAQATLISTYCTYPSRNQDLRLIGARIKTTMISDFQPGLTTLAAEVRSADKRDESRGNHRLLPHFPLPQAHQCPTLGCR